MFHALVEEGSLVDALRLRRKDLERYLPFLQMFPGVICHYLARIDALPGWK